MINNILDQIIWIFSIDFKIFFPQSDLEFYWIVDRLNKFIFITKEDIKITITINFYNGSTKLGQLFHLNTFCNGSKTLCWYYWVINFILQLKINL